MWVLFSYTRICFNYFFIQQKGEDYGQAAAIGVKPFLQGIIIQQTMPLGHELRTLDFV
jgi:hypothetical protein